MATLAPGETITVRGRVRIVRAEGGYRAELVSVASNGTARERFLSADTCEVLVDAVATVFVASHVEPHAPEKVETPPRAEARDAAAQASRPDRWRLSIGARGVVDRGLLPDTALGGAVDAAFGSEQLRVEVRVGALAPSSATSPLGGEAEIQAFLGDAAFCGARAVGPVRAGACVGVTAALLRGRGTGIPDAREENRIVPAPRLAIDLRWPARGAFAVRGEVSGRMSLARPEFVVLNEGALHRPSLFAVQLALGPELRF